MSAVRSVATLSAEAARRVDAAARAFADERGWPATICVADASGVPLVVTRADGAWPASVEVAIGKAASTIRFGRPSAALEDMINGGRTAFVGTAGGTPLRGGLPVVSDGVVVGAIGVSGLTPEKDEEVARAGAESVA